MNESDTNGFLKSILAAANDATPLLVSADWFDEHDEPELAEFIRLAVNTAQLPDGEQRDAAIPRLTNMVHRYGGMGFQLLPTAVTQTLQKKRKTGDMFRVRLGAIERRVGLKPWTPHHDNIPDDAARQLIARLAARWAVPLNPQHTPSKDWEDRDRFLYGQVCRLNNDAIQVYRHGGVGMHTAVNQLGIARDRFFTSEWLPDAEELVHRAEQLAEWGFRIREVDDLRSLRYLNSRISQVAENGWCEGKAWPLQQRLVAAMMRMGEKNILPHRM